MSRQPLVNANGFALANVLVFAALALLAWTVGYRKLMTLMRAEETVVLGTDASPPAPALARALSLLRNGSPPGNYSCSTVITSADSQTTTFTLTYTQVGDPAQRTWSVSATPGSADSQCPGAFG
jgi:hypothetical protein